MAGTRPQSGSDLAARIDHTLLKADAVESEVEKLCQEAKQYKFKAVCVNGIFVAKTRELLKGSDVLTAAVIGFPLGACLTSVKQMETELAVRDGAVEIDMVMRLDLAKAEKWAEVEEDIREVVRAAPGLAVKVILETGLLTREQIVSACRASENAGAAFVKTATGFLGRGATLDDVKLMRLSCSPHMKLKASGGIKTFAQAADMIEAGADRLGTSSGVALVTGATAGSGY